MGARPLSEDAGDGATLITRLRAVHLQMMDAVLGGDGIERVAVLAASGAGGPVAIIVPRLGVGVVSDGGRDDEVTALRRYVADRVRDRPAEVPAGITAEVPIVSGDDVLGAVLLLARGEAAAGSEAAGLAHGAGPARPISADAGEFLHLAAVACLTEVAIAEAKEEVEQNLRGSLLEDLRARPELDPAEVVRRAARLGCDLARGAVVLCAELTADRPRHVVATIAGEYPGALAQHLDDRVYALLPALGAAEHPGDVTLEAARALATRLQRHGTVGLSSFYAEPTELARALAEAELVLDVLRQSDSGGRDTHLEDIGTGTYRLLFRVLASHPEEVRSFYEDTVAPITRYDDQYATDLAGTLESYLEHNCNMNATAAAIYAHRHTVAYRLERVRELTGLDPMQSEDRERLGLGLKAYRIIAPRLPR